MCLQAVGAEPAMVSTERFASEATRFLEEEITAHVAAVETLGPPQEIVLGVPTQGNFTWGSFMRALAVISTLNGQTNIAGRDVPELLGKLGLIESRLGGKTFSQLGAAITLEQFGTGLKTNAVWLSLSPAEQAEWRALLNPERFYDRKTRHVIDLPENYMGVAARIITLDYLFGVAPDRSFADDVLEQAAGQFLKGALYTDDNLPTGRFDRYSQEYARFVYVAAGNIGRADIQKAVEPALNAVTRTWWALVSPEGYGYPWGRTIGAMSYMDSMEMVAFLAEHPEFRPAPLKDLAAVFYADWQALQMDYESERHLLNMFSFGRGNYHYMTPERQWQQTTMFLAKAADSLSRVLAALRTEHIAEFPAHPHLPEVARFDFFRQGNRSFGVWLVRQGPLRFTLPITTGVSPGIADYLPAPHGLPGFAAPVEQVVPALVPYLELADGRVIVTSDGADEIIPGEDGQSLRVVWRRWALVRDVGADSQSLPYGEVDTLVEPGLTTEVMWTINGGTLTRNERITASQPVTIHRFDVMVPSTGDRFSTRFMDGDRIDRFSGRDGTVEVRATSPHFAFTRMVQATGNSALGRGARGAIPLILNLEATDIPVQPGAPVNWTLRLTLQPVE